MKRFFSYSVIIILFITYIYTIVFRVIPISSKYFFEFLGLVASLKYLFSNNYKFKKSIKWVFRFALVVFFWDVIVSTLNGTFGFVLTQQLLTPIASVFGSQCLYLCSKKQINDHHDFLKIIIYSVFIETLITVLIKFSPAAFDFFDTIQITLKQDAEIDDISTYRRFVGIGNGVFFSALPSVAIGLLSIVYELRYQKNLKTRVFLYFALVSISLVGFLVVRTSIAIVALTLILLLLFLKTESIIKTIGAIAALFVFVFLAYYLAISYFDESLLSWGFDFLINKDLDNQNDSAYRVIDWWTNTSFDIKTFFLGDGYYTNPKGEGYYMGVDIGFFRRIFYGGVIGLGIILYYHFGIAKFAYKCINTREMKLYMLFLLACYLVILAKGDTTIFSQLILYLVFFEGGIFEKKQNRNCIWNSNK